MTPREITDRSDACVAALAGLWILMPKPDPDPDPAFWGFLSNLYGRNIREDPPQLRPEYVAVARRLQAPYRAYIGTQIDRIAALEQQIRQLEEQLAAK